MIFQSTLKQKPTIFKKRLDHFSIKLSRSKLLKNPSFLWNALSPFRRKSLYIYVSILILYSLQVNLAIWIIITSDKFHDMVHCNKSTQISWFSLSKKEFQWKCRWYQDINKSFKDDVRKMIILYHNKIILPGDVFMLTTVTTKTVILCMVPILLFYTWEYTLTAIMMK